LLLTEKFTIMPETQTTTETTTKSEETNLWNSILQECSKSFSHRFETRNVLVLGDRNCGKSILLARLQGMDLGDIEQGVALDYSFLDVKTSEDEDPISRINVWQLDGQTEHKNLLRFGINTNTISKSIVLITLDFSKPWQLIESLQRWINVLIGHINSVVPQLKEGQYEEMKNNLGIPFQQSVEEDHGKGLVTSRLLPLSEGVLSNNLGVPIVVVCCKTDTMDKLEQDYSYKDSHFDYIQTYLRKICLTYGAGLIYVSAKKDKNCDVLLQYIKHKLYGFEFHHKPQFQEKDIFFMPAGADSLVKINSDFENQNLSTDTEDLFEDVIKIPKIIQQDKESNLDSVITAEEDQEFLNRHFENMDKLDELPISTTTIEEKVSPAVEKPPPPSKPSHLPKFAESSVPSPEKLNSPLSPKSEMHENQALSEFFNNIIDKKSNRSLTRKGPAARAEQVLEKFKEKPKKF